MKATVIYPQDTAFQIELPPDKQMLIKETLDYVYQETQNGIAEIIQHEAETERLNRHGARLRSSMTGDIYIVNERYYMVDTVGFVEVSEIAAIKIQRVTIENRAMGFEWLQRQVTYLTGKPI